MANEYLKRTPTSSGNRKVFTYAGWFKKNNADGSTRFDIFNAYNSDSQQEEEIGFRADSLRYLSGGSTLYGFDTTNKYRDTGNWFHVVFVLNTTLESERKRSLVYINGVEVDTTTSSAIGAYVAKNFNSIAFNVAGQEHNVLARKYSSSGIDYAEGEAFDIFFVDGQALTPDVFGFYKDGDGYMSSGTTQATDFRPGQWSPRAPKSIKYTINRSGGFGVNGFYLPMNDSSNPGADFHCAPNSIIKLKGEDLPQPRNGAPTTSDAYVSELRSDPFAANLVLAIPGITGGQGDGYGDYSADIKGSGSNKTVTSPSASAVFSFSSYYGSALVFDVFDGNYLSIPNSSDFNFSSGGDFTVELWYYRQVDNTTESLIGVFENSSARRAWQLESRASAGLRFQWWADGSSAVGTIDAPTSAVPKDQWHHICVERSGDTITLYVNGVSVGVDTTAGSIYNNTTDPLRIGMLNAAEDQMLTGRLQDVRIYKGLAKYKGGFDVPKPYTPVGIESWRTTADTCKNNFATLNPLNPTPGTLSNGNLSFYRNTKGGSTSTFGVDSGKFYVEATGRVEGGGFAFGFVQDNYETDGSPDIGASSTSFGVRFNDFSTEFKPLGGSSTVYSSQTNTQSTVIALAVDFDTGAITVYRNGVSITTTTLTLPAGKFFAAVASETSTQAKDIQINFGQNPSFSGTTTAGTNADDSGKGLFKYAPPTGFLALCEDNLPAPAIADPGKHFKTVLWDGVNSTNKIKCGFQPDLVWIKNRGFTNWHSIYDSIRGPYLELNSNSQEPDRDRSSADGIRSFDSDGFTSGLDDNTGGGPGYTYVAWCWKAGGAAVSNTDGTITSQVSANPTAGFSIVSWTGNETAGATIGHGLAKEPDFIIFKSRNESRDWGTYHRSIGPTNRVLLNSTVAASADSAAINNTHPTSSIITLGASSAFNNNVGSDSMIAYCWSEIEGYSKFGSYVGNGNDDGPFVYCGFKPAWVMVKRSTTGANEGWPIFDSSRGSTNPNPKGIYANSDIAENDASGRYKDFVSNGFKVRGTSGEQNTSGVTYIFMAFAESPFQTANAK